MRDMNVKKEYSQSELSAPPAPSAPSTPSTPSAPSRPSIPSRRQVSERIMIALDYPTAQQALQTVQLIEKEQALRPWFKVGMQLFYAEGPGVVEEIKSRGYSVFVDLKLHDIPNTVKGAARSLTSSGADMFNLHCAGGSAMMEAAKEGIDLALGQGGQSPLLIGVTQLTSTSEEILQSEIGIPLSMDKAVIKYAQLAHQHRLDGVVSSPLEVKLIKETIGATFLTVTPGIRPADTETHDQQRMTTPQQAWELGTDFMVIGRAITQAEDPVQALSNIVEQIVKAQ